MPDYIKTAGILFFKNNKVLLVIHTEKAKHQTGIWGIPAGRLEPGETETETAIRETFDETRLKIDKVNLIPVPKTYKAIIKRKDLGPVWMSVKVFWCKKFKGKPQTTEENIPE